MNSARRLPVRQFPTVFQYMTPSPHTIGPRQSLAAAAGMMRDHDVRHLPVLDGGRIVGMLSQSDLLLVEAMPGVNPTEVRVEEAMVEDVFTVPRDTPIGDVVETMLTKKLGSAVVDDEGRVIGVFTTTDSLRALHELLERR